MGSEAAFVALVVLGLMLAYLAIGIWIFAALLLVAVTGLAFLAGFSFDRIGFILEAVTWSAVTRWELAAIPMFVWMGELMFRTDISKRLFNGLAPLVSLLPGKLLHVNIIGCTLFAAVSGSSAATTATVGKITTQELLSRGYARDISMGSLAGAGSLGLLIPPSIVLIVYGVLGEVSITKLFLAGVIPGLMIAAIYSIYIMLVSWRRPETTPPEEMTYGLRDYAQGVVTLLPVVILIGIVLGVLYSGVATPSEAGAVGVAASLAVIIATGQFSFRLMGESIKAAVVTSAMLCSILTAASFMSTAMGYLHIPSTIAVTIAQLHLGPYGLILMLALFYMLLGMFLEGTSITVMTLPITLPLVVSAGWDPVWFGIFLVVMVEMAQITPPVGFNLFILQSQTGESMVPSGTGICSILLADVPGDGASGYLSWNSALADTVADQKVISVERLLAIYSSTLFRNSSVCARAISSAASASPAIMWVDITRCSWTIALRWVVRRVSAPS